MHKLTITLPEALCQQLRDESHMLGRSLESHINWIIAAHVTDPAKTKFRGVYRYGKRWAAWVWDAKTKKNQRIGVFDTAEQAAAAREGYLIGTLESAAHAPTPEPSSAHANLGGISPRISPQISIVELLAEPMMDVRTERPWTARRTGAGTSEARVSSRPTH